MFLKMTNIKGESQDAKHKNEMDVLSWSWGTAERIVKLKKGDIQTLCAQDLHFTKYVDSSTPDLIMMGVSGETAKEATLTIRKSGDKVQEDFLVLKMTDVMVTSYQTGANALSDAPLMDQITLHFNSIVGEYRRQNPDGTLHPTLIIHSQRHLSQLVHARRSGNIAVSVSGPSSRPT